MGALYLDGTYNSTISQATGVGLGVGALTSPATSGEYAMLRGDHLALAQTAVDAYQLTALVSLPSIADVFAEVGFCDSDRTDYARLLFDTSVDSTYWRFETRDGSTQNATTLPTAAAVDTYVWLDVLFNAEHAAAWFNGDGPYPLYDNLPGTSLTPYVLVGTRTSTAKVLNVDRVSCIAVAGDVVSPAHSALTGSQ